MDEANRSLIARIQDIGGGAAPLAFGGRWYRSLQMVHAFICGFEAAQPDEHYQLLEIFSMWIRARYQTLGGTRSAFTLILERVGGDDALAFDEFFRLLPDYLRDLESLGLEGIRAESLKVIEPLAEARRRP